jgi:hypothetical protein
VNAIRFQTETLDLKMLAGEVPKINLGNNAAAGVFIGNETNSFTVWHTVSLF